MLRVSPAMSVKPVNNLQDRFDIGGKTCNIAIELVLRQCCKTSCMSLVARLSVPQGRARHVP